MDCIFCKIIRGEIPCAKIFEDENTLAFLSIGPISKGHTLVIPKKHAEVYMDLDDESINDLATTLKKVATMVKKGTGADGLNLGLNVHEAAGQVVPHVHFHVIPRINGDGLSTWPGGTYEDGEIEEWTKKIKGALE
ncbi:MAG: HIT family protein [Nanoarchaeota archaeon]|nr:HIT family protein [Nanoarchaeota archaeon]